MEQSLDNVTSVARRASSQATLVTPDSFDAHSTLTVLYAAFLSASRKNSAIIAEPMAAQELLTRQRGAAGTVTVE
jgi:hypothetical protein